MNTFSSLCSSDNWTAQAIVLSKLILEYPMGLSKIMLSTSFSNLKRPDLKSRFKEIPNETSTQLIQSTAQNSRKFPQSMLEQDLLFLNIDTETIVLLNSRFNILESIHPKFWENTQFRLSGAIISTINQKRTVLPDENLLPLISPTSPFLEKFLVCETYATNYKTSSVIFKFKIDYISEIKTTGKSKRVDVCLHDRQTKLFLLLDDDNVGITSLFEKDDNLYILNPLLTGFSKANQENQTFISYGPETILFLQPKPSSDCIPTQSSLIRSDSGTLDYRTLKTRLFTRDIRHDAINIVLFGRVSKVRSNVNQN